MFLLQLVQFLQALKRSFGGEFFEILFAKFFPLLGTRVEPLAQRVRGGKVFHPGIKRSLFFRQTPRPQPVYEDPRAVVA